VGRGAGISPAPPAPEGLARVRPGGLAILNRESRFPRAAPFALAYVPASRIAADHGVVSAEGRPLGNVAVLGACVRLLMPDALPFLEEALTARTGALARENVAAARDGYERCSKQHTQRSDEPLRPTVQAFSGRAATALFPVSTRTTLGNRTGTWSLDRPVVRGPCTACGVCALFCPEGAIARTDGVMEIDYLYCKGCGICEVVCPVRDALVMEDVPA
jgi:pyruvate ferredoxin oxidoreductase delta subunit